MARTAHQIAPAPDKHGKRTPARQVQPLKITAVESSIVDRAIEVIGDKNEALRWLGTPVRDLDYATPVSLIATPKGRTAVLDVLGRIEHGVM
jgi:putative toxin-antitoxin system antitoxin component (TIGR02293 family)